MKQALTIARRELLSQFFSPIGYLVLAVFAGVAGAIFAFGFFHPGAQASMSGTFFWVIWLMILLVPALSMRLLSEEYKTGTIETLMTTPLTDTQVVCGKWLGAFAFLFVLMVPLMVMTLVLEVNGRPDYGPVFTGLVGLLLVGGLFLAIGTFASAATQSQIIAFVVTVFVIGLLTVATYFLPMFAWVGDWFRHAMLYMNINAQFDDFNKGLIDVGNVIYFASGIVFFLFVAVKLLESKRWR